MRQIVCSVLELIGEDTAARSVGVIGVFLSSAAGEVYELFLVDDAGWLDPLDCGTQSSRRSDFSIATSLGMQLRRCQKQPLTMMLCNTIITYM